MKESVSSDIEIAAKAALETSEIMTKAQKYHVMVHFTP
jgi:hypothetical protein